MLIRLLVNTVSRGGNLLMNVGPTSRGYLDYRAEEALKVFADWMKYNSRSIYGCTMAEPEFKEPRDCRLTQTANVSICICSLIRSAICAFPVLAARWNTHSFCMTAAKSASPTARTASS